MKKDADTLENMLTSEQDGKRQQVELNFEKERRMK